METEKKELALHIEGVKQALKTLEEALRQPFSDFIRDATIQRFEYTFELSWKLLRRVAKIEGIEVVSPRQSIRSAFDLNLIEDVELWFEFLDSRNLTSHTYEQLTAQEVFESAKKFPKALSVVLKEIEKRYLPTISDTPNDHVREY